MSSIKFSKKNCYYNIDACGGIVREPLRIEFRSYYYDPSPFGLQQIEEIDLPPLNNGLEGSSIVGEYMEKLVYKNFSLDEAVYSAQSLSEIQSDYWRFYSYGSDVNVVSDQFFNFNNGLISNLEEKFTLSLRQKWLSYELDSEGKVLASSLIEDQNKYKLPYDLATVTQGGYNMNIGNINGQADPEKATQGLVTLEDIIELANSEGSAETFGFSATIKEDAPFIEDHSFEYSTPYSKDGLAAANITTQALDADVKFRYHYYLKEYEDAVIGLSDSSTSISSVNGLSLALKTSGDRVEHILPSPYDYEYANFVLDNDFYSNVTAGGGSEKITPILDTTKNVINSIQVFEKLYGADYVDYTSLGGKISFSLIRDGSVIDYLREWSKAASAYQQQALQEEKNNTVDEASGYEVLSQVAKNRNRFLAESGHIQSELDNALHKQKASTLSPDALNSLLNNAVFDYFSFNNSEIEQYFGDMDFTLRNSLNIGQKNTKLSNPGAAFPMSVEIKFRYPVETAFHPLAQNGNSLESLLSSKSVGSNTQAGLMQKIMSMNFADPFMRATVDAIDIISGGPTPINEQENDPTVISPSAKTPNFVRQASILQKEQYGHRTNHTKLHSVNLEDVVQLVLNADSVNSSGTIVDNYTGIMKRTSKTFFSDTDEDFFLPRGEEVTIDFPMTIKTHKELYETPNLKIVRRDFRDIIEGKKCFVETLFFGIEKYEVQKDDRGRRIPINRSNIVQRFFLTPPPLAGQESTDEYVRYVDTQVKFGKRYVYQIFAYVLVYGTEYRCSKIEETSVKDKAIEQLDETQDTIVDAFDITYQSRPSYKIFKVPFHGIDWEDKGGVFLPTLIKNNPPTAPYMEIRPYQNVNNQVLINMQASAGDVFQFPISIRDDEQESYEYDPSDIYFNNTPSGMLRFSSDDSISGYRIYRLDVAPKKYSDFNDAIVFDVNAALGSSIKDNISPNVRYYYTAKSIDAHGRYSNPCPVFSVELVDEKGLIYPLIEEYPMNMKSNRTRTKSGRKALYIEPARNQIKISSNADPENPTLGVNNKSVFDKRFKVRLTSRKTNKMIDFNVRFNQVNENKKDLDKINISQKEFLPKYAFNNYQFYSGSLEPNFDLALAFDTSKWDFPDTAETGVVAENKPVIEIPPSIVPISLGDAGAETNTDAMPSTPNPPTMEPKSLPLPQQGGSANDPYRG
tara:strand:- start:12793 stop:16371 length:3579 start_codon:yes stop_codon:yes gene_type:complete